MKDDLISRQAAVKALEETKQSDPFNRYEYQNIGIDWSIDAIKALPSAQPGQRNARVFQGIIVEYPSISAYPEYEGKPYFSIKYTENGQEFIGYGTYKPEVLSEYLKEYFMPSAQPGWIPCSTEMPPTGKNVLVTLVDGAVTDGNRWKPQEGKWFLFSDGVNGLDEDVLAWMPLPAPYIPEGDDKHEG